MRILFLCDDQSDYVSDPLYIGLSRVLGNEQVADYPYKPLYHDLQEKNWYMVQRPGTRWSREQVLDLLRDRAFDLVCLSSFRSPCLEECARLYGKVPFPPMVFVDGADDCSIRHDVTSRYPIGLYFKRDYIWSLGHPLRKMAARRWSFRRDQSLFERTIPLPLSLVLDALPAIGPVAKDVDVSYTGRASHPRRVKAVELLSRMDGVRFEGGVYAAAGDRQYKLVRGPVRRLWTKLTNGGQASESDRNKQKTPEAYYREIARSKIAVSIRGGGWTPSPRYYEIVAMNTMLISDAPEAEIPNNFVHRQHAVFCRPDLRDLESLVRYYLREEKEREAVAREGHAHLLKYHTCERRAEYFLDACRRLL
ncbi:MAG: hypothetical protein EXR96_06460 [Nitrospiraceae bacterium]|nr:hypothetical protein [Nitrospiraceae bacterium]